MRYTAREALSDDEACNKARLYELEAPVLTSRHS